MKLFASKNYSKLSLQQALKLLFKNLLQPFISEQEAKNGLEKKMIARLVNVFFFLAANNVSHLHMGLQYVAVFCLFSHGTEKATQLVPYVS